MPRKYVAVCGASEATRTQLDATREVGRLLAESGAIVINGGLGGVSGSASEGAAPAGGMVVGLLPDTDREGAMGDAERDRDRAPAGPLRDRARQLVAERTGRGEDSRGSGEACPRKLNA